MLVISFLTRDFTYHCKRTSDSSCYMIGYLVQHGESKHMYDKSAIFTLMHALLLSIVAYFIYLLWIVINFNVTAMSTTPGNQKKIPHGLHYRMTRALEVDQVEFPHIL